MWPHVPLVRTTGPCAQGREVLVLALALSEARHERSALAMATFHFAAAVFNILNLGHLRNKRVICLTNRSEFKIVSGLLLLWYVYR